MPNRTDNMGMTLKQFNRKEFWDALEAYKNALKGVKSNEEKDSFIGASLRIHRALGLDVFVGSAGTEELKKFLDGAFDGLLEIIQKDQNFEKNTQKMFSEVERMYEKEQAGLQSRPI